MITGCMIRSPAADRPTSAPESVKAKVRISEIICSKGHPEESIAVVNGVALRAGDTIDGMEVQEVEADGMILRNGSKLIKVKL